jgi:hypothetical protein
MSHFGTISRFAGAIASTSRSVDDLEKVIRRVATVGIVSKAAWFAALPRIVIWPATSRTGSW